MHKELADAQSKLAERQLLELRIQRLSNETNLDRSVECSVSQPSRQLPCVQHQLLEKRNQLSQLRVGELIQAIPPSSSAELQSVKEQLIQVTKSIDPFSRILFLTCITYTDSFHLSGFQQASSPWLNWSQRALPPRSSKRPRLVPHRTDDSVEF